MDKETNTPQETVAFAPQQYFISETMLATSKNSGGGAGTFTGYVLTPGINPTTAEALILVQALYKDSTGRAVLGNPVKGCPYPPECVGGIGFTNIDELFSSTTFNLAKVEE